ncbi:MULTISPECIES: PTS mannose transporter subunit IIC [unclassified Clostridioides]|uniref:PTS mannose transporter subunit IIC n=1 Tax=unclassified Clostridioides TaxID=2635829 RepID=UPI0007BAE163|nr:PTS mannose transporter subunit IIC [Clostridioides sp. ZZV14-6387]MCI9977782.1 PTS mannose transporter subunit IIC [Clostridioides difficile]MDB3086734.1 PTS mannose transporter subunit IIC [Clostridioides difficile]MDI7817356.1 PTS mannose transporter subunit IIC [Clostridioides difficile]NJI80342.1 PTS mannose transporter subunit IIC [Clostridioides difficile]
MNKYKAIILCHGTWGEVLVEEANENFGLSNQYEVLSLSSEKDVSVFMKEVEEVVDKEDVKIIISDLYGGSTSSVAIAIAIRRGIDAINGLSLQTILIVDEELSKDDKVHTLPERIVKKNNNLCVDLIKEFKKI